MTDGRPNPDALLPRIQPTRQARGKLKIFFGMCPGVGKTYAMLQAARQQRRMAAKSSSALSKRTDARKPKRCSKGCRSCRARSSNIATRSEEMDLDAILAWHPGSRSSMNWHTRMRPARVIRSVTRTCSSCSTPASTSTQRSTSNTSTAARDTVRQISGIPCAKQCRIRFSIWPTKSCLIDLTPEQLRARLAEGKVYLGDRAETAAENFFRESNLTALREMALRLVAEHVDRDLRDIMSAERIAGPWKSGDRLLVAVSASPYSERLIRYTRRLAASMEASWIVANIDSRGRFRKKTQTRLTRYSRSRANWARKSFPRPAAISAKRAPHRASAQRHSDRHRQAARLAVDKLLANATRCAGSCATAANIDIHMIPVGEIGPPRRETWRSAGRAPWREFGIALAIAGGRDRGLPGDLRLHRLLGGRAFLSARGGTRGARDCAAGRRCFSPPSALCSGISCSFRRASPFTSPIFRTS